MPQDEQAIGQLVLAISAAVKRANECKTELDRKHRQLKTLMDNWVNILDKRTDIGDWPDTRAAQDLMKQYHESLAFIERAKQQLGKNGVELP